MLEQLVRISFECGRGRAHHAADSLRLHGVAISSKNVIYNLRIQPQTLRGLCCALQSVRRSLYRVLRPLHHARQIRAGKHPAHRSQDCIYIQCHFVSAPPPGLTGF